MTSSIYSFTAKSITGTPIKLESYIGHVLLIANVASYCGLTDCAYKTFTTLSNRYYDHGLRILLFPCNQFMRQEPGTNDEIAQFINAFGAKFDVFEPVNVNGSKTHPLFAYLKEACPGTLMNSVKWNFTKFLIDAQGHPIKRYSPWENDLGQLDKDIAKLLNVKPTESA